MSEKWVYAFGGGSAEGRGDQKELLGGKGAGLAEMSRLGIPVPPGFTLTTRACIAYRHGGGELPPGLADEVAEHLTRVEELQGRRFGDPKSPLLVSVRSGAAQSMPGMMDTVLNLGLTRAAVEARIAAGGEAHFRWDAYRRLLAMYGDVVLGVPHRELEHVLAAARERQGVETDAELSAESLAAVVDRYEALIERHAGRPFPQDPQEQLWGGIRAVFDSWDNQRARDYRRLNGLPDDMGTGVNVQAMVFGNRGDDCGTGVAFTRSPATGEPGIYGEFLVNAQGEDVVAGIRTPQPIEPADGAGGGMRETFPQAYRRLAEVCEKLEDHYRDMQDVEFTVEAGELYMLQTRTGKRTGPAAVRIAADLVASGLIDQRTALSRIEATHVEQMMAPVFDVAEKKRALAEGRLLARGLPAGPGAACGRIALTAERAAEMAGRGTVLLVREETSPEDIVGMHASAGILTSRGGMTSHAAVVARGLGKPCIVGAGGVLVDEEGGEVRVGGRVFREGDELSIDGTAGEVIAGALAAQESEVLQALSEGRAVSPAAEAFLRLLCWADGERRLRVRANADTPEDARHALDFGAEGIGLCRTEHMFFGEDRILAVRRMILAQNDEERHAALAELLPLQRGDFEGIFRAMDGLPVTVRLLDPPLHEFLPHDRTEQDALAEALGIAPRDARRRIANLEQANPMLGHRGCRLGITQPAITRMQTRALLEAALRCQADGVRVELEIMVPLVGTSAELEDQRKVIEEVAEAVLAEHDARVDFHIGTMIEMPRAAIPAYEIAQHADFFSFGTNDLTQMTFGYSRDDTATFLPFYIEHGLMPDDPFQVLDRKGVGALVEMGTDRGRKAKPNLKVGICGEHGGEPASVTFCHEIGLDYVSCSPFRVPIARLAAAQAHLRDTQR